MPPRKRKPEHPFDGIYEKLKRADQNVIKLNSEINAFLKRGKYFVMPHHDHETWQDAVDYNSKRVIPLRFPVLAGEIVHHLRSCLDHIAWQFSSEAYRNSRDGKYIEFPILMQWPEPKDKFTRYERKINGITSPEVLSLIYAYQPCNDTGNNPETHVLGIIHDMDRYDKHRELALVRNSVTVDVPPWILTPLQDALKQDRQGKLSMIEKAAVGHTLKKYGKPSPSIAFTQIREGETHSVIPALKQLVDKTRAVVDLFAAKL